jgi:Carboxypeptidase regulatory-like domain/TonB dependent receptor
MNYQRRLSVYVEPGIRLHAAFLLYLVLGGLVLAPAHLAQNITGTIVGTVKDSSGAVMPGVTLSVNNVATNLQVAVITDAAGDFVAPTLPPGTYNLKTEASGFKVNLTEGVRLLANRTVRVDVVMEPGEITQQIEVAAAAPVVNSENATIGNVLESQIITTLPLNGRTLDRLIRISAGVTSDSASNPRVAGSSYWGGIQFNVDGVTYNDSGNGGGAYSFRNGLSTLPSIDTVSEFKIDSNNQKAEFEGSASVTIVSKTGTNDFHGSVFEFNRNKALAARNAFATALAKPPFNRNEFGFTIGGPIIRDKTFFYGSYEGLRERFSRTNTLSVGTPAMRSGDFLGLPTIIDPLNGQAFSNNRIPAERIDPRAEALLDFVPLPNLAGVGPAGTLSNYVVTVGNISDINRYGLRLDHKFSSKDTLWGSYNRSKGSPYFVAQNFPPTYGQWEDGGYQTESLNVTHTHVFTARTLNELRYGGFYHGSVRRGMNTDFDPQTLFPDLYGPLPLGGLPRIDITSHVQMGDYGGSERGKQFTNQIIDNLTLVRGRHTIKTGIDFANYRVSSPPGAFGLLTNVAQDAGFGRFTFNGRYTNNNPAAAAQPAHAFADFLLGYAGFTYRSTPSAVNLFYQTRYSAYAQDDWQISPKLTLSFGLRYMVQTSWKERDKAQANLDFASGNLVIPGDTLPPQASPRLAAAYPIVTSAQAGLPDEVLETDKNNFAPRVGFAFRPFANSKTVIRGGAGFYYNTLPVYIGFRQMGFSNPPFLLSETFEAAAGALPSLTLAQPFPGAGAISPNPSITAVERNIKNSLSQQWNLTLERELASNLGMRISYVGNKTSHLPWYNRSINIAEQQAPGALQPRRPYQPWSDILLLAGGGDSTIHQLQVEAVKRFSQGLSFQAEYSWNRSLDNVPIVGGPQNPYNNRADRGNSDQIRRHIFTIAYSYDLPFGPGKPFANVSGALGKLVGGWQISGITYLRTGQPFSVSFNATQPGWFSSRANLVADPKLPRSERSVTKWFDPAAFVVPAPFTYGNAGRNMLFAPGDIVFDGSVLKDTKINERWTIQFRAEFFNLPNHTNLGGPAANISVPAQVGRIFSAGDPRQIQFGLKVLF